jgi:hypothetical protein
MQPLLYKHKQMDNLCGGGESMLTLAKLWWPVSWGNGGSFLPVPQKQT